MRTKTTSPNGFNDGFIRKVVKRNGLVYVIKIK